MLVNFCFYFLKRDYFLFVKTGYQFFFTKKNKCLNSGLAAVHLERRSIEIDMYAVDTVVSLYCRYANLKNKHNNEKTMNEYFIKYCDEAKRLSICTYVNTQ